MKLKTLYGLVAASLLTTLAHAGPGWEVTSFSTSPQNAPKLVAALDQWMAAGGKDYPGQVTLLFNEADGTDPATHTILVTYASLADQEAFAQRVQTDEQLAAQWDKLMGVFTSLVTPVQTARGAFLRSWGDVDPSDTVWMHHFITAVDAPGVVAALDGWMNSDTGKKMPGQLHLSGVVAGGLGSPSHIVSVGFASQAEMETWNDSLRGNADYAAFLARMRQVAEYHGANMALEVKSWGAPPAQTASR